MELTIKTKYLRNGLCVIGEEIPFVRSASIGIWVKNGSVDENRSNNGISHFVEHMMFKGTKKRTARALADEMSEMGGRINAFTSKEYMCYYAHTLDTHLEDALDVLSDMLLHSQYKEDAIEKEKSIILEEINMVEDSPEDITHHLLVSNTWRDDPLGLRVIGTRENVQSFKKQEIVDYISSYYIPQNIVISITGKFEFDQICDCIEEKFISLGGNTKPIERVAHTTYQKTFSTKEKDIEQVHMLLGFPTISYDSKDIYYLSILNTLFGGGMNSRLFQSIREELGLAYSIYSFSDTYKTTGLLNIYAATHPSQVEDVVVNTFEEINKLIKDGLSEKEIYKTKEQLKSNIIIGFENMNSRMSNYGKTMLMLGKIKTQDEMIEGINSVDKNRLIHFAQQVFNYEQMSVALVGRLNEFNVERIESLCRD